LSQILYTTRANHALWRVAAPELARDALAGANVDALACAFPLLVGDDGGAPVADDADAVLRDAVLLIAEGPLARAGDPPAAAAAQLERWNDQQSSAASTAVVPRRTPWRNGADAERARATLQQALLRARRRSSPHASRRSSASMRIAQSLHAQLVARPALGGI
jgi:uncharacterized membrane protein